MQRQSDPCALTLVWRDKMVNFVLKYTDTPFDTYKTFADENEVILTNKFSVVSSKFLMNPYGGMYNQSGNLEAAEVPYKNEVEIIIPNDSLRRGRWRC